MNSTNTPPEGTTKTGPEAPRGVIIAWGIAAIVASVMASYSEPKTSSKFLGTLPSDPDTCASAFPECGPVFTRVATENPFEKTLRM